MTANGIKRWILCTVLTLFMASSIPALPIEGEFWVIADLLELNLPGSNSRTIDELSPREEDALATLIEDARWAFSGMIYGFSVRWTPPAQNRNVAENLQIRPLALIPRGDPRLKTLSTMRETRLIHFLLGYSLDETQAARLEGWQSAVFPSAGGFGRVSLYYGSRREAMEAGIRDALYQWLRLREYNRPREITGRVAFTQFPVTSLDNGFFTALVHLKLDLDSPRPYFAD